MHIFYLILLFGFIACNSAKSTLESKEERLTRLIEEQGKLSETIQELKTSLNQEQKVIPVVSYFKLVPKSFKHFIHLQASVESDKTVVLMPALGPGRVHKILVKLGQKVAKGQAMIQLDDTLITAQIQTLQTRLNLARDLVRRQQRLWEQKIGTELELKQRQNELEYLEAQLESLERNRALNLITAPVSGLIDRLDLHEGDIFSGYAGNQAQVRIVNLHELKASILVPDIYIHDLKIGTKLKLTFADGHLNFNSHIQNLGQYIDKNTRSFTAYAELPTHSDLKINMIGSAEILDYTNPHSKVLPIDLVLSDPQGKYVLVLESTTDSTDYTIDKRYIVLGKSYDNMVEVSSGLNFGDLVLVDNKHELSSGMQVRIK